MRKIYKVIKDGHEVKVTRDEYNKMKREEISMLKEAEKIMRDIFRPARLDDMPEELTPKVVDEILNELIRNDVEEATDDEYEDKFKRMDINQEFVPTPQSTIEEKPKKKPKKKASKKKVTKTDD
jgi:hypothetical protein